MTKVYLNGELVEQADAKISVFDHGLVVGDGVFETILMHDGHPFALSRHLDRLERSMSGLGIIGVERSEVADAVAAVVASAEFARGRIRITITSGSGPLASSRGGGRPTVVVALGDSPREDMPCPVEVMSWTRNENGPVAGLKTISYAENARALAVAHDHGADEAIFANTAGNLCEGTGSNVFVGIGDELFTPTLSSGCLQGTTRDLLLDNGIGEERDLPITDLYPNVATEAFLASSIRGVQPISSVDGQVFGQLPGPLTKAALAVFDALLEGAIDP